MKHLSWMTGALAAVMIVLAAFGALCSAVVTLATDMDFYSIMSRGAVMDAMGFTSEEETTACIGLTGAEQEDFARGIVLFMKGETDVQPDILNERELQHMRDVRGLILLAQKVSQGCVTLAAVIAVAIAWTGARLKSPRRAVLLGVFAGLGVLIFAALGAALCLNTAGFEALFVGMHELLFKNDLWLLNPQTDILIRMMPQLLFERAAQAAGAKAAGTFTVTAVMLGAVCALFSGMIRRQLAEKEK